jgi:hypothetical protein
LDAKFEDVLTTSVKHSYEDIYSDFAGTSGAAPIVAGAVLSIQGMVDANRGSKLLQPRCENSSPFVERTLTSNSEADK